MPTHTNQTVISVTRTLRDRIRAAAVANHTPMTKVIEAALAAYTAKAKPTVKPRTAHAKSLAMSRLAVSLSDSVRLDRTEDGTEYVTLSIGDLATVTLTPEKHRDGTVDVLLSIGSATLVIGQTHQ